MIKILLYLANPFAKLFRALAAYGYAHSFLFRFLASFFTELFQKIRRRHLIIILIALIIVNARSDYWQLMLGKTLSFPQSLTSYLRSLTPTNSPKTNLLKTNERKETTDDEGDDDEDVPAERSPWTLLQTALPSCYEKGAFPTKTPAVAFILTGLGLNKDWTEEVLTTLRGNVTIAISPYSHNVEECLIQASKMGYHGIIGLPLEPYDYPNPDPGPLTVLTGSSPEENRRKTKSVLAKAPKSVSVIGEHGSRFTLSEAELEPVLKEIRNYGSAFIDPRTTLYSKVPKICKVLGMNCHQVDLTLPLRANTKDIDDFFKKVIRNAQENGIVIVSIPAIPDFIRLLTNWTDVLEDKGITLVTIDDLKKIDTD
jgi:polysaccharide deacetylase 2 family uncharacterized protein YibQ